MKNCAFGGKINNELYILGGFYSSISVSSPSLFIIYPTPSISSPSSVKNIFLFYYYYYYFTLQYCIGFAIHQHASATGVHVLKNLS